MDKITLSKPTRPEQRREDYPLITGRAHYVDDLRPPEGRPAMLHMAVVRSPYAHARIEHIQLAEAQAMPGIIAAFTGAELVNTMPALDFMPQPDSKKPERRPMALDRVRYVGDPVAVVLAESQYGAIDARDLIDIEYEPLRAVTDPEASLAPDAPLLYEEFASNVAFTRRLGGGDIQAAFSQAEHTLRLRLVNQRLAASPLEPRACLFDFDPSTGQLSAWLSSQAIYRARETLSRFLGLDRSQIRVYNADVGGGFGSKTIFMGEEIIAAALAVKYARPVKWIEDRSENLQAQMHGRGQINYIEAAFQSDGRILGLKVSTIGDLGAFLLGITELIPINTITQLSGPYRIPAIDGEVVGVFTNKSPTTPYRGAGRPEATYILERTLERIARELQLDPVEVRRRNLLLPTDFPYTTVTGLRYDSGNYQPALERALELAGYTKWREQQCQRRQQGSSKLLGIGLSTFNEISGDNAPPPGPLESATVRICRDGSVQVQSGVSHTGQGHFTTFAQIVAERFALPLDKIEVLMNDSALPAFGIGTFGSRTIQTAGVAVFLAAEAAREKALQVAARLLEAAPADLVLEEGQISVRGVPARAVALGELARLVEEQPELIEHESPNPANGTPIEGLAAWHAFQSPGATFSSGTHLALVEVDSETGETHILNYVALDDCGHIINHLLAEGQLHGALAQGIGQALYEEILYDEEGQPLSGTLMDYALPNSEQVPSFIVETIETPSPYNPLGAKGIGESGCIGAPPTIVNAVLDALAPLGITALDMPLKPATVWAAIQAARNGTFSPPDPTPPAIFSRHTP
ncbi:xanthine dehydrogenase family protein molybdopterin-binding subunit [Ktedonosporobacter rubrisoli]|uniref:Xanthine dehydrogenase family protein molybdopterin-binding subunit n=1 Tax=Ktedonosporobacter rubrisoli TaxID=2509675 RepID=A0A4P6K1W6_KTERU|nr:xanthine dehydrogenase family protein molybdopterin-binding subunit [Ktedonosporobacter rubrisoli]QBD81680.1 xanthine dehydrogenase family protein molybdopterin-binding subunit [Ktedonosporobacter rubrisoli]